MGGAGKRRGGEVGFSICPLLFTHSLLTGSQACTGCGEGESLGCRGTLLPPQTSPQWICQGLSPSLTRRAPFRTSSDCPDGGCAVGEAVGGHRNVPLICLEALEGGADSS